MQSDCTSLNANPSGSASSLKDLATDKQDYLIQTHHQADDNNGFIC